jgi:hypothetical protein
MQYIYIYIYIHICIYLKLFDMELRNKIKCYQNFQTQQKSKKIILTNYLKH